MRYLYGLFTFFGLMLALLPLTGCSPGGPVASSTGTARLEAGPGGRKIQSIRIRVNYGFQPDTVIAKPGVPLRMEFYRDEAIGSCAQKLEIPERHVAVTLPNRQAYTVLIPAHAAGEMPFRCSMNMMRGRVAFKEISSMKMSAAK
jgi:plastocyanin domain-containing protein